MSKSIKNAEKTQIVLQGLAAIFKKEKDLEVTIGNGTPNLTIAKDGLRHEFDVNVNPSPAYSPAGDQLVVRRIVQPGELRGESGWNNSFLKDQPKPQVLDQCVERIVQMMAAPR